MRSLNDDKTRYGELHRLEVPAVCLRKKLGVNPRGFRFKVHRPYNAPDLLQHPIYDTSKKRGHLRSDAYFREHIPKVVENLSPYVGAIRLLGRSLRWRCIVWPENFVALENPNAILLSRFRLNP